MTCMALVIALMIGFMMGLLYCKKRRREKRYDNFRLKSLVVKIFHENKGPKVYVVIDQTYRKKALNDLVLEHMHHMVGLVICCICYY